MTTTRENHTEFDCMSLAEVPTSLLDAMLASSQRRDDPRIVADFNALSEELARRPFEPVTDAPWVCANAWRVEPSSSA